MTKGRDHPGPGNTNRPTAASHHQHVTLSKENGVSMRSLKHMPTGLSRDGLAANPQGRVLTAAGHSGFGQAAEECTVSVCCTDKGDLGQCNKKTQSGSDCFEAWRQRLDPFIDGQISALPSKVPTLQKNAQISLRFAPLVWGVAGNSQLQGHLIDPYECCVVSAGSPAQMLRV